MCKYSIQSFLVILALLFVPSISFADDVYSPGQGALCDKVGQTCFDTQGASIGITKDEFGQAAADKLSTAIEEVGDDWDPTQFTMSNGVSCNTTEKVCNDSSGQMDTKMTIALFGNAAVTAEDLKASQTIDGQCKLYNKKSDNNKLKGDCTIEERRTDDSREYIVTFASGETYKFMKVSDGYKVDTPDGPNKNIAKMTDEGDKGVFSWGKWKLIMKIQ